MSAFSVIGYWSGVTIDFSIKQPMIRASVSFRSVNTNAASLGLVQDGLVQDNFLEYIVNHTRRDFYKKNLTVYDNALEPTLWRRQ